MGKVEDDMTVVVAKLVRVRRRNRGLQEDILVKRHCDLFPEIVHNLDEYNMVGEGQRVLLAVSWGQIRWLSFIFISTES